MKYGLKVSFWWWHMKSIHSIYPFDDGIIKAPYYLHFQKYPYLHYDYTHLHGCTYDIHLSHLETHDFPCPFPSLFEVGGTSSHTWVRVIWLKNIIIERNILWYYMMTYIFMSVLMRILLATWSVHVFLAPYFVQILVEVLHSLIGWKNTWMIILMNLILFFSSIIGHGILTYVIGVDLIKYPMLVCMGT